MNVASGCTLRVASSRFIVPLALTPKSVCGSDAAQSCDGCAAVWIDRREVEPMRSNSAQDAVGVADVERLAAELVRELLQQALRRAGGRGIRPEEARAHVVLDADDVIAGTDEMGDRLGADQPSGPRDDNGGHWAESLGAA